MTTNQQNYLIKQLKTMSPEERETWEAGYLAACEVLRISGHDGHYHARATEGFLRTYKQIEVGDDD